MGKARNPYGGQTVIGRLERGLLNAQRAPVHVQPTSSPPKRREKKTAPTPALTLEWLSVSDAQFLSSGDPIDMTAADILIVFLADEGTLPDLEANLTDLLAVELTGTTFELSEAITYDVQCWACVKSGPTPSISLGGYQFFTVRAGLPVTSLDQLTVLEADADPFMVGTQYSTDLIDNRTGSRTVSTAGTLDVLDNATIGGGINVHASGVITSGSATVNDMATSNFDGRVDIGPLATPGATQSITYDPDPDGTGTNFRGGLSLYFSIGLSA